MKYFERIDGLRALAVAAVMWSHYVPKEYHFGIPWGAFGVNLFFVISGFLITGILHRAEAIPFSKTLNAFYLRRFLRIFPLYYFCLVFVTTLGWAEFSSGALWHWLYASNWLFWFEGSWGGSVSHFWSLAVEEQFYLFWPILFLFVGRRVGGVWVSISLVLLGILFRAVALSTPLGDSFHWDILTPACFESLGMGAVLSGIWQSMSFKRIGCALAFTSCALCFQICPLQSSSSGSESIYQIFTLWSFMILWFLCRAKHTWADVFFLNSVVRYLGMISYGLYIWHNFMGYPWGAMAEFFDFPDSIQFGLGGVIGKSLLTVVFSSATWYGFEKPLLKLKERFTYT